MKSQRLNPVTLFSICVLICLVPACPKAQAPGKDTARQLYGIFNNPATRETRIIAMYPDADRAGICTNNCFQGSLDRGTTDGQAWQGSATLAYDRKSDRFFYAGRIGAQASVWSLNSRGTHERINPGKREWSGHGITKMATGPDGYVYALTTPMRDSHAGGNRETLVVRIRPVTANHQPRMETIGRLSAHGSYRNAMAYSGDMAFAANGDLYIFGTEIDTVLQYYKGSHIFRIAGPALQKPGKSAVIPVENLGRISGLGHAVGYDSTVINGVAFLPDGAFILSAVDKGTQSRTFFFRGRIQPGATRVLPMDPPVTIPPGFVVSDLASGSFPPIKPARTLSPTLVQRSPENPANDWEKSVTIRTVNY